MTTSNNLRRIVRFKATTKTKSCRVVHLCLLRMKALKERYSRKIKMLEGTSQVHRSPKVEIRISNSQSICRLIRARITPTKNPITYKFTKTYIRPFRAQPNHQDRFLDRIRVSKDIKPAILGPMIATWRCSKRRSNSTKINKRRKSIALMNWLMLLRMHSYFRRSLRMMAWSNRQLNSPWWATHFLKRMKLLYFRTTVKIHLKMRI